MTPLLESLTAAPCPSPTRQPLLETALRQGLPDIRNEAWKYTSLRALRQRRFAPAGDSPSIDPALMDAIPAPRLVFVNGRYAAALSDLDRMPEGIEIQRLSERLSQHGEDAARMLQRQFPDDSDVFANLNGAFAEEGVWIQVQEQSTPSLPVHMVFIAAATEEDQAWHPRHMIDLRHGARLTLFEHHLSIGAACHLDNSLAHIHLKRGAVLHHARIQHHADGMTSLLRSDAVLARDAHYQRLDLELGARLSRHELNVRLEGEKARLTANGVLLSHGRRHLDTRLGIAHIARDTACDLNWRGVATEYGRIVFHGGIHIRPGADGADANLTNKNLLLSPNAEVDSQPVLVIDAEEVKATHGATVGQLDANALFYLYSRGIPEAQARQLLTAAFCREPLSIAQPDSAGLLMQLLDHALNVTGVA